jgi:hypothetical protein
VSARTAFMEYISSSKPLVLRRTQRSSKPVRVGVRVLSLPTGRAAVDVTVDLTVYEDGSYEVAAGGEITYVGRLL